ncbi:aminotransferase class I/II-fold pyridoxal phosphate-dependent enzyme [Cytobacillus massiliigabonensis]|uniref:aminotransferase class I/II-fold pyridoxal phosphate-dependent enzyme n=1 Tax=Cytobacillus massiliigabonensis TaxID=1871011 RepID=UPI000C8662E5|nr:aminotransferase class I/II-fold pyridoxal phosphate-dependent enzyme [Cytobacillus massiliigabonensis]
MNQTRMPLFEKLKRHADQNPVSFHVPGHKYGELITGDIERYYKQLLRLDATEINGLDDLHSPEGIIKEAEELLTQLYGVKKSFFLVNGSTVGNLAMIMAAVKENDTVLVQRNCHKSILNGINLVKATPIFLGPVFDEDWGIAGGVSVSMVKQAIELYPHAKALILTYPNYYGMVNNLDEIIKIAHCHHIPVLIDEAHGAHFIGGEYFPPSAVQLNADIVIQSAHKTLPAMTMGAYLHFNSDFLSLVNVSSFLQILQSSSPSYPIMASLDIARNYLATFTARDAKSLQQKITEFRNGLQQLKEIRVLTYKGGIGDPLKVTIQSTTSLSGYDLQKLFESKGIYTEMADPSNVVFVFPLLKYEMAYPIREIITRLQSALKSAAYYEIGKEKVSCGKPGISRLALNADEQAKIEKVNIPIEEAIGKICAQLIVPYPPGIPLLFPGEIIREEAIEQIQLLKASGARFQGDEILQDGKLIIYST